MPFNSFIVFIKGQSSSFKINNSFFSLHYYQVFINNRHYEILNNKN